MFPYKLYHPGVYTGKIEIAKDLCVCVCVCVCVVNSTLLPF